ncbi:MAG: ThiF family adenylyltransferase, partial [Monoglobales bacterium]
MADIFLRTERLIGEEALLKLKNKHVAVFGVGGVGSYVVEALARCGIGRLTIIDKDVVDVTNINRQLIALHSTIGKVKVDIAKNRILDINPDAKVNALPILFNAETKEQINFEDFDYVVDAIDMVTAKLLI